jgi:hypothetical protein
VTVAVVDWTVDRLLLTATGVPMSVDASSADPIGRRRWNCTVPFQVDTPCTETVAESLTDFVEHAIARSRAIERYAVRDRLKLLN